MDSNLTFSNIENMQHYFKNKFPSTLIFENFVQSMELITSFKNEKKECVISRLITHSNLKNFLKLIRQGNTYRIDYESSYFHQRQLKNVNNFNNCISKRNVTIDLDITDYRKIVTICGCVDNNNNNNNNNNKNNNIKFCKTCHNLLKISVLIIVTYLEYVGIYDYVVIFSGSKGYHIKILQDELTFDPYLKKGILCTFSLFSKMEEDLKIRDCFQKKIFENDSIFEHLFNLGFNLMFDYDNCIDFFKESNLIILINCIIFKEEKINKESFFEELKLKFINNWKCIYDKMDVSNNNDNYNNGYEESLNISIDNFMNSHEYNYGKECFNYFYSCVDILRNIEEINYPETLRRIIITFYFPKIDEPVLSVENHATRVPYTINKSGHISSVIRIKDIIEYDNYYKIIENTNIFSISGGIDNEIFLKNFLFLENNLKMFDFFRNNFFIFKKDEIMCMLKKEHIQKMLVVNCSDDNNDNNITDRSIYKKESIVKFLFKYYKKKKLLNNFEQRNKIECLIYFVHYVEKNKDKKNII